MAMKSEKADKTPRSRSLESIHREKLMRAMAPLVLEKLGMITGNRSVQRMQMVDVRPSSGPPLVIWVKCAWRPGKGGNCAVQMTLRKKGQEGAHTAEEAVAVVTDVAERAKRRGATHVLFLAADNGGHAPLAAYLLPIGVMGTLTLEAATVDQSLTLNGSSPSFYVTASDDRQAALVEVVHKHAIDLLHGTAAPPPVADAIEDLDVWPEGVPRPERKSHMSTSFPRDPAVRAHVLKRAGGRCEYCGNQGFKMGNGKRYLEAHHIIALANQGPDTLENVIALCAGHHREAHYGVRREELEAGMIEQIQLIMSSTKYPKTRATSADVIGDLA